jgi:hypothetical protein
LQQHSAATILGVAKMKENGVREDELFRLQQLRSTCARICYGMCRFWMLEECS